jgi:hypothetical protein
LLTSVGCGGDGGEGGKGKSELHFWLRSYFYEVDGSFCWIYTPFLLDFMIFLSHPVKLMKS